MSSTLYVPLLMWIDALVSVQTSLYDFTPHLCGSPCRLKGYSFYPKILVWFKLCLKIVDVVALHTHQTSTRVPSKCHFLSSTRMWDQIKKEDFQLLMSYGVSWIKYDFQPELQATSPSAVSCQRPVRVGVSGSFSLYIGSYDSCYNIH
jgi:hypothetical protein